MDSSSTIVMETSMGETEIIKKIKEKGIRSVNKTLASENEALSNLVGQYRYDHFSQGNLTNSLEIMLQTVQRGGKIVFSGIGKSYKIAGKLVATSISLSISAALLHPSEALHGDLGMIGEKDCIIFVTASGNTPELLNLLPHIPEVPVILLTCNRVSKLSTLAQVRSLLLTELPKHLNEDSIHGVPAPTVSTTLSLVLADATILALLEIIEDDSLERKKLFSKRHPGGSIGADLSHLNDKITTGNRKTPVSSLVSSSSLLSLNQVRQYKIVDNQTDYLPGSESSSDDEDRLEAIKPKNHGLSYKIKNSDKSRVLTITDTDFDLLSEDVLFKWTILYDFIVQKKKGFVLAVDCDKIKPLIRHYLTVDGKYTAEVWNDFTRSLESSFTEIYL
ncbi:uncharacterized protein PRCAT00000271001 [Priceomyces carsonii]|uniref:uncharacterized protein n=1 Tax=Priceomyces carsonii TaxID=28549 RepID=UPI002ED9B636|nr:unnamed protein product [Priceomyces carsonii]